MDFSLANFSEDGGELQTQTPMVKQFTHQFHYYRLAIKLLEGNVFSHVCHSVHWGMMGHFHVIITNDALKAIA